MTPKDMAVQAMKALSAQTMLLGLNAKVTISLVVEKGKYPKGGFPRGELCNEQTRKKKTERVYQVDAAKVLIWLIENEMIVIKQSKANEDAFIFSNIKEIHEANTHSTASA